MAPYTLSCIGFDAQQCDSISAVLDLASSALNDIWQFSDAPETDVVLINMNEAMGQQLLSAQRQLMPDYRIIIVAKAANDSMKQYWFLTQKPSGPPSLRETVSLLNQVAVCLSQALIAAAEVETPELPKSDNDTTITVENSPVVIAPKASRKVLAKNYLFGTILQAENDNNCRAVKLKQLPTLYLSPKENAYYFSGTGTELLLFITSAPKQLVIRSPAKLDPKKAPLSDKHDLAQLKAQAIIYAAQGRILEGHSPEAEVKLEQLPNYADIPVLEKYKPIADYMLARRNNLYAIAEELHRPLSEVFDFYNVAYLFGYLKVNQQAASKKSPSETKNSKTFGYFLRSLFKQWYRRSD